MAYDIKVQIIISIVDSKTGKILLWDDTNTVAAVNDRGFSSFKAGLSNHLLSLASQIDDLGRDYI